MRRRQNTPCVRPDTISRSPSSCFKQGRAPPLHGVHSAKRVVTCDRLSNQRRDGASRREVEDSDMDRFKIEGGRRLEGTVAISGAKNAALPAMAAALLTSEPVRLLNIPRVRDIITMAKLLAHMRCRVESPDLPPSEVTIQAETVSHGEAPYELVKTMRASVLTLGPLVARFGYARVSLPGGCAIGARPIDLHIQGLETLGTEITV